MLYFILQLPEKAMFQIKQHNAAQILVSEWQLEEAQVFWAKKEQSLALGLLRQMVDKLEANSFEVDITLQVEIPMQFRSF